MAKMIRRRAGRGKGTKGRNMREGKVKLSGICKTTTTTYSAIHSPSQRSAGDFTVAAVKGFIRSISLSDGNSLQDTLRLLTVWFEHGHQPGVSEALVDGLKTIQIDTWLQVREGQV